MDHRRSARVASTTLLAPAPVYSTASDGPERMGKTFAWMLARDDPRQMCALYTALGLEARRNLALAIELFAGSGEGLSPTESAALQRPEVANEFIALIVVEWVVAFEAHVRRSSASFSGWRMLPDLAEACALTDT
jgi:hypothetical protein